MPDDDDGVTTLRMEQHRRRYSNKRTLVQPMPASTHGNVWEQVVAVTCQLPRVHGRVYQPLESVAVLVRYQQCKGRPELFQQSSCVIDHDRCKGLYLSCLGLYTADTSFSNAGYAQGYAVTCWLGLVQAWDPSTKMKCTVMYQ
jgi:hypothetical protein